jgi:hypothetical protein
MTDPSTQEIGQLHRLLAHVRAELEAADADEAREVDLSEADFEAYAQLDVHPLDFGVCSTKPEMEAAVLELGAALEDAVDGRTQSTFDQWTADTETPAAD